MKRGFTLIELLVVISIIAVLIALLLPALARAKQEANTVACLSNEQQIGLAFSTYLSENDSYPPPYTYNAVNPQLEEKWYQLILGRAGVAWPQQTVGTGTYGVLFCPSDPGVPALTGFVTYNGVTKTNFEWDVDNGNISYGYNMIGLGGTRNWYTPQDIYNGTTWLDGSYPYLEQSAKPTELTNPAKTIVVSDTAINLNPWVSWCYMTSWGDAYNGYCIARHAGLLCNVVWADGHATSVAQPGLPQTSPNPSLSYPNLYTINAFGELPGIWATPATPENDWNPLHGNG